MHFVSPAGAITRRVRPESQSWHMRLRRLFGRGSSSSTAAFDPHKMADIWIAEYGDEAAWHATRKIAELLEWDDHEGAAAWVEVLNIIQGRTRACKPSGD
jgi:hypothetical protein